MASRTALFLCWLLIERGQFSVLDFVEQRNKPVAVEKDFQINVASCLNIFGQDWTVEIGKRT